MTPVFMRICSCSDVGAIVFPISEISSFQRTSVHQIMLTRRSVPDPSIIAWCNSEEECAAVEAALVGSIHRILSGVGRPSDILDVNRIVEVTLRRIRAPQAEPVPDDPEGVQAE